MLATDTIHRITPRRVEQLARAYHKHIPASLSQLEQDRLVNIPSKLHRKSTSSSSSSSKNPGNASPALKREDLLRLTEWKLKRGKFRPTLMKLVASNAEESVQDVTRRAFEGFAATREGVLGALKTLTELKGVGPATASLVLAVFDTEGVPFFSDEVFAWIMSVPDDDDDDEEEEEEVELWEGKMAYSAKEFGVLWTAVEELRARFAEVGRVVPALDVEHAAWMVVKGFARDVAPEADGVEETAGDDGDEKAAVETGLEEVDEPPTKKRKAAAKDPSNTTNTKKSKKKR